MYIYIHDLCYGKQLKFVIPDYKRARAELKKRSTDTLRLQKKARKGCKSGELQRRVETSLQDVTERRHILEETEKKAVRAALIEERSRFCLLVAFLKPVVVICVLYNFFVFCSSYRTVKYTNLFHLLFYNQD